MTIEIHRLELEALIRQRLDSGEFDSVEDVILHALRFGAAPKVAEPLSSPTGADLVAAMQASPCKEIELEPERLYVPIREVAM